MLSYRFSRGVQVTKGSLPRGPVTCAGRRPSPALRRPSWVSRRCQWGRALRHWHLRLTQDGRRRAGEGMPAGARHGPRGRLPFVTWTPRENRYGDTAYRRVGRSGLRLPTISLGLWNNFGDDRPLETQRAILRRAFDLGITHFDLANN